MVFAWLMQDCLELPGTHFLEKERAVPNTRYNITAARDELLKAGLGKPLTLRLTGGQTFAVKIARMTWTKREGHFIRSTVLTLPSMPIPIDFPLVSGDAFVRIYPNHKGIVWKPDNPRSKRDAWTEELFGGKPGS